MNRSKRLSLAFCLAFFLCILQTNSHAQEIKVPMQPRYWEYDSTKVMFVKENGLDVIKGIKGAYYQVFLKDQVFGNGIIEYDVALTGMGFPGINFRMSDDKKNGENFYIRSFGPVSPAERSTLQYAAFMDGLSIWDLSDEYQAGAAIYQQGWNHVKLVVTGKQMLAYVNDMAKPALVVPELEGRTDKGLISLTGNVVYANLVIRPKAPGKEDTAQIHLPVENDTRYIRHWQLSPQKDFPFGQDVVIPLPSMYGLLNKSGLPDSATQWTSIQAEKRGIVNLSRIYGAVKNDGRRLAWLKTTIHSGSKQERQLSLGFSDEVWLFVNGQLTLIDKNYFGTPSQKNGGRCIIDNAQVKLNLKEGDNELLIGLANYFYGWGMIARLDEMSGIELK